MPTTNIDIDQVSVELRNKLENLENLKNTRDRTTWAMEQIIAQFRVDYNINTIEQARALLSRLQTREEVLMRKLAMKLDELHVIEESIDNAPEPEQPNIPIPF